MILPRLRRTADLELNDRLTVGLATLAAGTAGSVLVADVWRRFRRRLARAEADRSIDAHAPGRQLALAGQATQDSLRVAREGYVAASRRETVLINLLGAFSVTFVIARLSTFGIRGGWWPFGNLEVGERHIHHFVPGILLAFASGAGAMITDELETETRLALPFGVGVALTFDEAALLLDLRDVYWSREGMLSVQLSLGLAIMLAAAIVGSRLLARGEERGEAAGLIPDERGEVRRVGPVPQSSLESA